MVKYLEANAKGKSVNRDQKRWDEKYKERQFIPGKKPNAFLRRQIRLLPKGKALDLACGDGTNAVFLAQQGFRVEAVDISKVGLKIAQQLARAKRVKVRFRRMDLNSLPLPPDHYDLITDFYFLNRRLVPRIKKALKPGGRVVFETYTTEESLRGTGEPQQVSYLLKPNELLRLFAGMRILFYREGVFRMDGRRKGVASLIAEKRK